jgi:hypothetical protein
VTIYSGPDRRRYQVEFWSQPWRHWIMAQIYHRYDVRIFKVPGFKRLENWLLRNAPEDRLPENDRELPLGVRQHRRCWRLTNKRRTVLATVRITTEQYQSLGGSHGNAS